MLFRSWFYLRSMALSKIQNASRYVIIVRLRVKKPGRLELEQLSLQAGIVDSVHQFEYIYKQVASNRITSKGIQYLSQRNFCNLAELFLSNFTSNLDRNNLGNLGCKMISKSNWPQLKYLSLSRSTINRLKQNWLDRCESLIERTVQEVKNFGPKYFWAYEVRNNIGNDGIKKFNKGIFLNLESLSLTDKFVNPRDPDIRNNIEFWEAVRLVLS